MKRGLRPFGLESPMCSVVLLTGGFSAPCSRSTVRNLGVIFDSSLKLEKQISAVVKSSFFHLRVAATMKPYLPAEDLHTFISSHLDYQNASL